MIVAPISSLRVGLKTILAGIPGIEIVAEAADLDDTGGLPPQIEIVLVALLEYPANSWLQLVVESNPHVIFLFLLNPSGPLQQFKFPANFVFGLLDMNALPEEIRVAISSLKAGFSVIDPRFMGTIQFSPGSTGSQKSATGHVSTLYDSEQDTITDALTGREVEILQALAQGMTNKEIARQFAISEHTVKYHIASIFSKLGANNRTEAVRQGVRLGIITI
jgi:DNA-binding NarL/FixJ family response regulator